MALFGVTLVLVDGVSMGRVLPHRTLALFRRKRKVSKGDIVLVKHPEFGRIVKIVAAVTVNGRYSLRGAHPNSTSEERLGAVEGTFIQGTLVCRLIRGKPLAA
ncbi:MAG: S24 family peptidase [Erythrobacter sp.]